MVEPHHPQDPFLVDLEDQRNPTVAIGGMIIEHAPWARLFTRSSSPRYERLARWLEESASPAEPLVNGGDFNVAPEDVVPFHPGSPPRASQPLPMTGFDLSGTQPLHFPRHNRHTTPGCSVCRPKDSSRTEARWAPAVAFAAEVKIPTARSRFIGSGKPDYTVYSIASKQWGAWDTLNLAYAWIGRPAGVRIQNVYGFAVAVERSLRRFDVVAEVLGNTAALAEGQAAEGGESTVAPEVGGEELVATVGGRFHVSDQVTLSLGGSYDNQRAVQVHPGITLRWR